MKIEDKDLMNLYYRRNNLTEFAPFFFFALLISYYLVWVFFPKWIFWVHLIMYLGVLFGLAHKKGKLDDAIEKEVKKRFLKR